MSEFTIGILGGMGPRSTAPFLEEVLNQCQVQYKAEEDMDYPHMMIYSLPTPFYTGQPVNHEDMEKSLVEGIKKLEASGVDLIAIPCNTAHRYYKAMEQAVEVPIINMIEATIHRVPKGVKVAIFGTDVTMESGLYQRQLEEKGQPIVHDAKWQEGINAVLSLMKKTGLSYEVRQIIDDLIKDVKEAGADCILLACTDLGMMAEGHEDMRFIDTSKVLAEELVARYLKETRGNSYCGINCQGCPVYKATVTNDVELKKHVMNEWGKMYNREFDIEEVQCRGCKSQVVFGLCAKCDILKCNKDKGLDHCLLCKEYPCERMIKFENNLKETGTDYK